MMSQKKRKNIFQTIWIFLTTTQNTNGGSGLQKTNTLLNPIKRQPHNDKIFLYAKDQYEPKHQHLMKNR